LILSQLKKAFILSLDVLKIAHTENGNTIAKSIAVELGGLPLALEQAGAYIEETRCGLERYLTLYQTVARKSLLAYKGAFTLHDPIAITLSLTFEQIQQTNSLAYNFLSLAAFYAPDHIPEELLTIASPFSPTFQSIVEHPELFDDSMGELNKYSLIRRYSHVRTCSIHPLVQTCLKDRMDEETQKLWAEYAIWSINEAILSLGDINQIIPTPLADYISHAEECLKYIEQWKFTSPGAATLLSVIGAYLVNLGDQQEEYERAENLLQEAYRMVEEIFGLLDLATANSLINLAELYNRLGKYSLAEEMYLKALTIYEQIHYPMDQILSQIMSVIAEFYIHQEKYEQAEQFCKRSIDINDNILDVNDPRRLKALVLLSWIYSQLGKIEKIQPITVQITRIMEEHKEDQELERELNDLVVKLSDLGFAGLEFLLPRIARFEEIFGAEHPNVGALYANLANLYAHQYQYDKAEELLLKAITTLENALGAEHTHVADAMTLLGTIYYRQGRFGEAELLFQRSISIHSQIYGADSSITKKTLAWFATNHEVWLATNSLVQGRSLMAQRKLLEAEPLYQEALVVFDKVFGVKHPEVVSIRKEYIEILYKLGWKDKGLEQRKILRKIWGQK